MIIDQLTRSILLKICYFGPALSGKATTIKSLLNHFGKKDRVLNVTNSINRTVFFDYGTIEFEIEQWHLKIHLYSTTGQDFYLITRPISFQAIDGVIFVADSQQSAYDRNLTSWKELRGFFEDVIITIPKVIAFNKQDLPDKFSPPEFLEDINHLKFKNLKTKKTIAIEGVGVVESFKDLIDLIFKNINRERLTPEYG